MSDKNHFGHDPDGKVTAFMRKYSGFKVPLKVWGKKARTETGYVVESAFIHV